MLEPPRLGAAERSGGQDSGPTERILGIQMCAVVNSDTHSVEQFSAKPTGQAQECNSAEGEEQGDRRRQDRVS